MITIKGIYFFSNFFFRYDYFWPSPKNSHQKIMTVHTPHGEISKSSTLGQKTSKTTKLFVTLVLLRNINVTSYHGVLLVRYSEGGLMISSDR